MAMKLFYFFLGIGVKRMYFLIKYIYSFFRFFGFPNLINYLFVLLAELIFP